MNFLHKAIAQAKAAQDAQTASAAPGTAHTTMIDAMVENLSKPLRARSHKQVHASDVTKEHFCPREIVLRDVLNLPRQDEKVGAALAATFDIGNVTAELVRAKWLGKHALGGWECVKCKEYVPLAPKPATAGASCQHYWKYQETLVKSAEYDFSGSFDVIADLAGPKFTLCEIKVLNPDEFEELQAPKAEHRVRTSLYLWLVEHGYPSYATQVDHQVGKVLYVARTFGKKAKDAKHKHNGKILPFKEFDVHRNDATLKLPLERAWQVKEARKLKVLPQRVCPNSWCPTAKGCQLVSQCFDPKMHYPTLTNSPPSAT